jgi:hypothetical protein
MRKLRLTLDELAVETFATGADVEARGTVAAREAPTIPPWCDTVLGQCTRMTGVCACTPRADQL